MEEQKKSHSSFGNRIIQNLIHFMGTEEKQNKLLLQASMLVTIYLSLNEYFLLYQFELINSSVISISVINL